MNSDSDSVQSEGGSPFATHQSKQSHPFPKRSQSTPGQIFGNNNNRNPFDDDFENDPFAEDNPMNPFNNPFQININHNAKKNKNAKRTEATQQEVQQQRSKTPEPQIPSIQFKASDKSSKTHNRRNSQPVNKHTASNLDDIFSDFQPKLEINGKNIVNSSHSPPKTKDKKRSKSVFQTRDPPPQSKRRASVKQLPISKKTGYDISYFIDKDVAYKYLCIMLSVHSLYTNTLRNTHATQSAARMCAAMQWS